MLCSLKYFILQVSFRRPTHANNNLIAIIPTDSESDSQTNDLSSKSLIENVNSKYTHIPDGTKSTDIHNFNTEGNSSEIYIYIYNCVV